MGEGANISLENTKSCNKTWHTERKKVLVFFLMLPNVVNFFVCLFPNLKVSDTSYMTA